LFQKNSSKDKIRKNDSLLLTEILKENFTKSGKMEFFEDAQKLLKNNFLKSLGDWNQLSEEEKKKYPDGLKILLNGLLVETLEDFIDTQSLMLQNVEPNFINEPFVERQEVIQNIKDVATLNYKSFVLAKRETTVKQNHHFTIVNGGSGSGKTRACKEFANYLKSFTHLNECFKDTKIIFIDFSNGDQLLPEENDVNQILGLRLFANGLAFKTVKQLAMDNEFNLKHLLKTNSFEIGKILKLISTNYRRIYNLSIDSPIPLIIVCDEFQLVIDLFPNKEYKNIYKVLGEYMCPPPTRRGEFIQNNLIIYPVISGTITREDVKFELTDYGNITLKLFPLTWFGIKRVLEFYEIRKLFYDSEEN
jgi:hypothetical protein